MSGSLQRSIRSLILAVGLLFSISCLVFASTPANPSHGSGLPSTSEAPGANPWGMSWLSEVHEAGVRQLAAQAGVKYSRVFIDWSSVEPVNDNGDPDAWNASVVNWSGADSLISKLLSSGMMPIVTITGNPAWAATTTCGRIDIASLSEFGEFLRAFVERYDGDGVDDAPFLEQGTRVSFYSLYSEPDALPEVPPNQGGCWGRNGAEYAQMMQVAWQVMHAADPSVKVTTGALAYDNFHPDYAPPGYPGGNKFNYYFLDDMLSYIQSRPGEYFDYLNFNYYELYGTNYWEPLMGQPGIIAKTQYLRQKMAQYGYNKPLINSEVGEESGCGKSEETQARYVPQIYARGMAAGLDVITWWPMRDYVVPGFYDCRPGLIRLDNSRKLSYWAFKTMASELTGHSYGHGLTGVAGVEGYVFTGSPEKTVLWSSSDTPRQVTFPFRRIRVVEKQKYNDTYPDSEDPAAVRIIADGGIGDLDGLDNGHITITVGSSPIYVEPVGIAVNPSAFNITVQEGQTIDQTLIVENTGGGTVTYSITDNRTWLSELPTSGSIGSGESTSITVTFDATSLTAGTYTGEITIQYNDGAPAFLAVPVTLTVCQSILQVTPTSLGFDAVKGGANPPAQDISISNGTCGALDWEATEETPWLNISPSSGSTPSALTASVDIAGLSSSVYTEDISVTATTPGAQNSPQTVRVTLTVRTFADVPLGYWALGYIEALARAGITTGYPTDPPTYGPLDNVNRAQMATFLIRALGEQPYDPNDWPGRQTFSDVPRDYWAWGYIERLYDLGITTGYPTNPPTYGPLDNVNRAQMAVFLIRALGEEPYDPDDWPGRQTFSDVARDYWAWGYIERLYDLGITTGYPTNPPTYGPLDNVNRAQMATFLVRAFGIPMWP